MTMARDTARDWMWSEACEMLARADRMHRELFRPAGLRERQPTWEPPVDILETDFEVVAVIAGARTYPPVLRTAAIHRLELPQGRFYRRVRLPAGRYSGVRRAVADGCLVVTLQKAEAGRG
jgi:HSP20 family protein